jgi:hypothetical protein
MSAVATPADTTTTSEEAITKVKVLRLLNSDSAEDQERALRLIGHYAHTDQFGEDFYRLMITPLQYLVAKGETESLRIMAVSALHSIGTEEAIRGLEAQADMLDSDRVAKVTKHALLEHKHERAAAQR